MQIRYLTLAIDKFCQRPNFGELSRHATSRGATLKWSPRGINGVWCYKCLVGDTVGDGIWARKKGLDFTSKPLISLVRNARIELAAFSSGG